MDDLDNLKNLADTNHLSFIDWVCEFDKVDDVMQLMENFNRNRFHECEYCKADEIAYMQNNIYYCSKCYCERYNPDDFKYDENYSHCDVCGKEDIYGRYYSSIYCKYARVCREHFIENLKFFISPPCNIKPAKNCV